MKIITIPLVGMMCWAVQVSQAQTPTDAVMMKQREFCFAAMYDYGSFNHYYEGDYLRTNATIATVYRKTFLPMLAIGLHDRINLIVGAPYIQTRSSNPNGGRLEGAKGLQDFSVTLKAEVFSHELGSGKLHVLTALGYSTPMTNYLSDYMPYSLGFGANEFSARAIAQYKLTMGLYARVSLAHQWRGQTKAERDYYYNNGSYYTPWMDVPNAWNYQTVLGTSLLKNALRLEASFSSFRCTSGDDIRSYNAPQPTNKVVSDQVGFMVQYYFPQVKGLGVLAYYNNVINGRNCAKIENLGGGLTYQFKL